MSATAQLLRKVADRQGPYLVAVFLPEQRDKPTAASVGQRLLTRNNRTSGHDLLEHHRFDRLDLLFRQALTTRVVKAQAPGRDFGAGLVDVVTDDPLQRGVQQVRCGVVALCRAACTFVNCQLDRLPHPEHAAIHDGSVQMVAVECCRRLNLSSRALTSDLAPVADLATTLGIERRGGDYQRNAHARFSLLRRREVFIQDRQQGRTLDELVVADEPSRLDASLAQDGRGIIGEHRIGGGHGRSCPFALRRHRGLEARFVQAQATLLDHLTSDVDREAEGVV